MNILQHAYDELFPEDNNTKILELTYNGRFKGYNANIRMTKSHITVNASKNWKDVSHEIQKGLCQELLMKLFKTKKTTIQMELYHNFIRQLANVAPKTQTHSILEQSFQRINDQFFANMMEQPNLKLGKGINRLGTYDYTSNTVTISENLLSNDLLLDYVMYHELLHKKHQYKGKAGKRTRHHTKAFKEDEKKFPNHANCEKELENLVRKNKQKKNWFF
ncbi:hypothetical protein COV18_01115 [Candidatus Woesearchaeota archaeon CG10_big_fil_rev_8_21_14_0_10_37_12]|nr:MAG: hypothetical protein COV18_01115 [Candidatus Woesearchaeota archaeon CG10_big_fil_rev_8_21_14_0_10_37_12]